MLVPGLFVRAKIPVGTLVNAVMVPQRAIASGQGQKYVLILDKDNTAFVSPVKLGREVDGMQVVTDGLKAGDTVVVDGLLKVRAGEKVNPKPLVP